MSVYKRGDKWHVSIRYPDRTRFRRAVGTKKQAEALERQIKQDIADGRWRIHQIQDITFRELVKQYLEYAQVSKAASTFLTDKTRIEKHILPFFRAKHVHEITPRMVDSFKAKRVRDGAAPKTINNELLNLSHIMKMAIRWQYVDRNVVTDVEKLPVPQNPPRFLSLEEIERLQRAAKGSHIYPLIVTALHTGMRKSELLNLQWSDIDFQMQTVTVQSKEDWHTKNYKSRTLQMTVVLHDVFREHAQKVLQEQGVLEGHVFTYKGKPIKQDFRKSLGRVMRKAGLEGVTLHTLRHTFASQLVMAGVSLRDVQELMGHQSYDTTLRYAHLAPEHVKKQVARLPFGGSGPHLVHKPGIVEISLEQEKRRDAARRLTSG